MCHYTQYTTTLGSDVNSIPTAIFNNSGTWIQTPTETANTHPITKTLGGYRYTYLASDAASTTHTLLTNPTTHYIASDYGILPNNPNTWIPFSSTITKTIYDPCPYGYRVPINGSWNGFPKNTWIRFAITGGTPWPTENGGWWPAAALRDDNSAVQYGIGDNGRCWSSSHHSSNTYVASHLHFNYNSYVSSSNGSNRSHGFSVRCIERRKKQSKFLRYKHQPKQLTPTL